MSPDTDSLEKIEADVAFNEKMLHDLSEVVVAQGREIDKLRADIAVLERRILQIIEGEDDLP